MWKKNFNETLQLMGHRNWILVVDKAYPLQSADGIEYINTDEPMEQVLPYVLSQIDTASHVKPVIYTDRELQYLSAIGEEEAAMVASLDKILEGREVNSILHDEIFEKLDSASQLFNVLVIKSESTIAYSSVFMELDCGYWTSQKEKTLRKLMK